MVSPKDGEKKDLDKKTMLHQFITQYGPTKVYIFCKIGT